MISFELREISQFNTFKIFRINSKMIAVVLKEFFGFLVTVMTGFPKFSNGKTPEKAEMVLASFCSIFIFFQCNDVLVVFDVVR